LTGAIFQAFKKRIASAAGSANNACLFTLIVCPCGISGSSKVGCVAIAETSAVLQAAG
jgi:hypothetical protein